MRTGYQNTFTLTYFSKQEVLLYLVFSTTPSTIVDVTLPVLHARPFVGIFVGIFVVNIIRYISTSSALIYANVHFPKLYIRHEIKYYSTTLLVQAQHQRTFPVSWVSS